MSQENVETVRAAYAAFESGDIPGALSALDPDVEWSSPASLPWGGTQNGHDETAADWGKIAETLDDFAIELDDVIDGGDTVVVIGRSTGRVKSNGVEITNEYVHVFEMNDEGKAARVRIYSDPTDTVRALESESVA